MKHYEIALIIHPDQGEQVPAMIERYKSVITDSGGTVHRVEDWKRQQLAYLIDGVHKAHYIILNIEVEPTTLEKLTSSFKFNDAVLRNLVISRDKAITEPSPMMAKVEAEENIKAERSSNDTKEESDSGKTEPAATEGEQ